MNKFMWHNQLIGFKDKDRPHHIYKPNEAIYGLKQARRAWYKELSNFLIKFGFQNTISCASLFVYNCDNDLLCFLVYVDNFDLHRE